MRSLRLSILPLFASITFACSSSDDGSQTFPPGTQPPGEETPATIEPKVHFFSERDGFATEIDSIVFSDQFALVIDVPPKTELTIVTHLYSPGRKGRGYTSKATFVADEKGVIDTHTMAPVRGDYRGVDPDGLVWSAKEGPLEEGLGPDRTAAFFELEVGDAKVGLATLKRTSTGPTVKVEGLDPKKTGVVGQLYMPQGANDRVPIVAFGGSEGGIMGGSFYAMRLASYGHPVLALAYFGAPGVPSELEEIPLEYFGKAFTYLDGRPETRKGKAVVVGGSRGGELALLLGATYPDRVAGVIADTPSSHRWAGLSIKETKSAWTFEGTPLAFVPSAGGLPDTVPTPEGGSAWVLRSMFEKDLAAAASTDLDSARIEVEKTNAPILMIGGGDDGMWPACDFMNRAMAKLTENGHVAKHGDEAVCFEKAGHSVSSVGLPTTDSMWAELGTEIYALGGTAEANAHAAREGDRKVQAFLRRVTK